ncbi:amino acid ABC transporter ATP-binding/permease protein [Sphingomonas sp. CLY1604]|uniref:amino acid ABC transporter ATP-binding/permease protein n=1 Tax=Sphingomonas sp. CLY1604 TaxID=3457786 RepID=UPI003FD8A938
MTHRSPLAGLIAAERRAERRRLRHAAWCAALVAAASVVLLGLSGWFLTAAARAGGAGIVAAQGFNYMLPSAGIRLLAIVRTGARYGERLAGHAAAFGALARLRPALFRALTAMAPEAALALGRGEATARLIGDIDAVELRFVRLSGPWGVMAALLSGGALTLLGGWPAAATVACAIGTLLLGHLLARRLEAPGRAVQRATGALREEVAMLAGAAAELRCFGLEAWAVERIADAGDRLAVAQRRQASVMAGFEWLHAAGVALAAASALMLAAPRGAAVAALAALAAAMTVDAIAPVLRTMTERGRLAEAEARLDAVFDAERSGQSSVPASLGDASLVIDAGRCAMGARIALVGPSGSGKSTLVEGLLGLRPLMPGRVALRGQDAATLPGEVLRATFAWAPQDAALIAGTVRDNLCLADATADDDRLWQALADAGLDAVVRTLPQGLDEWLGDDGARLSGGERRRLSLARAYLARTPWLLLDEPIEGLDGDLAAQVAGRLDVRLKRTGQGLIVVSHRSVLTALCDRQWQAGVAARRSVA